MWVAMDLVLLALTKRKAGGARDQECFVNIITYTPCKEKRGMMLSLPVPVCKKQPSGEHQFGPASPLPDKCGIPDEDVEDLIDMGEPGGATGALAGATGAGNSSRRNRCWRNRYHHSWVSLKVGCTCCTC